MELNASFYGLPQQKTAQGWHERPPADFLYARLHGHEKLYASNYSDEQLRSWVEQLSEAAGQQRDIFVYFDNDIEGYAPQNALRLREILADR